MGTMTNRKVLWVREVRTDNSGQRMILCASENHQDVYVSDVFKKHYKIPLQAYEEWLRGAFQPAPTDCAEVELTIAAIDWPKGKASNLLPSGHTGAIRFMGADSEIIAAGSYLET